MLIELGVTQLKKTKVEYLLDLFEGRWHKEQCDLVSVERLYMIGWFQFFGELVLFQAMGVEFRDKKYVALRQGSEMLVG